MPLKTVVPNAPKTVGERIRVCRGDLTQYQFAALLNQARFPKHCHVPASKIAQATISRYETGESLPEPHALLRISRVGNTSMEWVLTGRHQGQCDA